ncbi:MAG TPA: hypothetical protein H9896_01940 [Candidatus Pygmaiobacter gallistercoris]|nr:hypothetical protein [Candidatus Pygmaiobacter gallistercoris]
MDAIRREWRVQCRNLPAEMGFVLGGFLFGRLLAMGILFFTKEDEWLPFGAIFGAFGLGAVLFTIAMQFVIGLNRAILMSRTRTNFMLGGYSMGIFTLLLALVVLLLLSWIEFCTASADDTLRAAAEQVASVLLHPLFLLSFPVCGTVLAGFIGALLARFGWRAGWTLWGIWMLGALVLPRMIDASKGKDTLLTRAGNLLGSFVLTLTPVTLAVAGLFLTLAALAATVAMIRTKQAEG